MHKPFNPSSTPRDAEGHVCDGIVRNSPTADELAADGAPGRLEISRATADEGEAVCSGIRRSIVSRVSVRVWPRAS